MDHGDTEVVTFAAVSGALQVKLDGLIGEPESVLARQAREQRRINHSLPMDKQHVGWTAFTGTSEHKSFLPDVLNGFACVHKTLQQINNGEIWQRSFWIQGICSGGPCLPVQ